MHCPVQLSRGRYKQKAASLLRPALHFYIAALLFGNLPSKIQPYPYARQGVGCRGPIKTLEDPGLFFFGNAGAGPVSQTQMAENSS